MYKIPSKPASTMESAFPYIIIKKVGRKSLYVFSANFHIYARINAVVKPSLFLLCVFFCCIFCFRLRCTEIGTRYDFKGSKSSVTLDEDKITLIGDDDFKLKLVKDIIHGKLVKRGISLKNLKEEKKEAAAGGTVRQVLSLQNGISSDMAKDIVKRVKASKIKVAAKINGDEVRVSSKDKDCLQECIQFLKQQDIPADLQFVNYR